MRPCLGLLSIAALVPVAAWATTIAAHTVAERAQESDRVALVQVLSRRVEGRAGAMKTLTEVAVGDDVRGHGPSHLTIVQLGGSADGYEMHVPGDAAFDVGEVSLVFLRCDGGSRCGLVAFGEGKIQISGEFAVVHDMFTNQYLRRPLASLLSELRALPVPGRPATSSNGVAP